MRAVLIVNPNATSTTPAGRDLLEKELKRLDDAIDTLRADVDSMLDRGEVSEGHESREVLEAYRMFAHDRGWLDRMREAVSSGPWFDVYLQNLTSPATFAPIAILTRGGPPPGPLGRKCTQIAQGADQQHAHDQGGHGKQQAAETAEDEE